MFKCTISLICSVLIQVETIKGEEMMTYIWGYLYLLATEQSGLEKRKLWHLRVILLFCTNIEGIIVIKK